jgi:hypothetical protein
MVQVEQGLSSGCKCPECAFECHDCMGSAQPPMEIGELKRRMEEMLAQEKREGET